MSLFKARDWWNTKAGDNEEFDIGCMVVGNISNVDTTTAIGKPINLMTLPLDSNNTDIDKSINLKIMVVYTRLLARVVG